MMMMMMGGDRGGDRAGGVFVYGWSRHMCVFLSSSRCRMRMGLGMTIVMVMVIANVFILGVDVWVDHS